MLDDTPPGPGVQSNSAQEDRAHLPDILPYVLRSLLWHNALIGRLFEVEELRSERRHENERHQAEHFDENELLRTESYKVNRRLDLTGFPGLFSLSRATLSNISVVE